MDHEVLARLMFDVERLRISGQEISTRLRLLDDVEIVIDDAQFDALERGIVTNNDLFCLWMNRF